MNSIQVGLILLTVSAALISRVVFRSKMAYRLMIMGLLGLATVLIIVPDLSTSIAHKLGVGRGTDLLFYLFFFTGTHVFLLLYMRTRKLELKLTESIRALAVRNAEQLHSGQSATNSLEFQC